MPPAKSFGAATVIVIQATTAADGDRRQPAHRADDPRLGHDHGLHLADGHAVRAQDGDLAAALQRPRPPAC